MKAIAMKQIAPLLLAAAIALPAFAADVAYVKSVEDWRAQADESLRRDNGWLTLAGRYVMKEGANTFGTGRTTTSSFRRASGLITWAPCWSSPARCR